MKIFCAFVLTTLLITRADAQQSALATEHQWVALRIHDGSQVLLDLAHADYVTVDDHFAVVQSQVVLPGPGGSPATYLWENDPDPVLKKALLDAAQSAPDRWLSYGPNNGNFVNFSQVTAVYFGTDEEGNFARVITRKDSVLQPNVATPIQNPNSGIKFRLQTTIERLKKLAKLP